MSHRFLPRIARTAAALLIAMPLLAAAAAAPGVAAPAASSNVPEPGTWVLVGVALVAVAISLRKRK